MQWPAAAASTMHDITGQQKQHTDGLNGNDRVQMIHSLLVITSATQPLEMHALNVPAQQGPHLQLPCASVSQTMRYT
jgi:hypothetical protein